MLCDLNDNPEDTDNSSFTENLDVDPRRRLSFLDVAALIIDQMVGSGIFVTPGLVLSLTKSKPIGLALWGLGGVHAFLWCENLGVKSNSIIV
jgi:hypothetical protein